jgi:hypothetical protein
MSISDYLKNPRGKIGQELLLLPSVAAAIGDEREGILLQEKVEDV